MLGHAEYKATSADLMSLGKKYEQLIREGLNEDMSKQEAVSYAREIISAYPKDFQRLLKSGLTEVAENAVNYYANQLGVNPEPSLAEDVVASHYTTNYYGASLAQRVVVSERILKRRLTNTAAIGTGVLDTLFTKPVPFGSQVAVDNRILLSSAAKIENEIAKRMAEEAGSQLIRWTLSHRHVVQDQCDILANAVDRDVADYMVTNGINADATGVYFRDQLPDPPHPNCQCEYHVITDKDGEVVTHGRVTRTIEKIRNLLRRLRRR